jgi:nucleotide-binding universal stress UspA family protein
MEPDLETAMYGNILAAVNEHSNSEVAARYAIHLAKACEARLTLIFVAGAQARLEVIRQAESALERLFLEAGARQVQVETLIQKGDPFRQISAVVREKAIDLVFSATRREDVSRRYFVKTLSRKLMLNLPCSVALVRVVHPGKFFPQKILVPFRGRPARADEKAFFVARLAAAFGAQVTLFHAPESLAGFLRRRTSPPPLPPEIEQFKRFLEELRIPSQKRLGYGPAGRAITESAAIHHDDLIIMGASERGLWASLVGGNPVEQVLRETFCNLIILLPRLPRP